MDKKQTSLYEKGMQEIKNDKDACAACVDRECRYRDLERGYCLPKAASFLPPEPPTGVSREQVKSLISKVWDCYNKWNSEGYVTDEMSEFADRVEDLTTYLSKELELD